MTFVYLNACMMSLSIQLPETINGHLDASFPLPTYAVVYQVLLALHPEDALHSYLSSTHFTLPVLQFRCSQYPIELLWYPPTPICCLQPSFIQPILYSSFRVVSLQYKDGFIFPFNFSQQLLRPSRSFCDYQA